MSGKVVVVTGGTRGIGLGLVRSFADLGATVVFCGRSAATVEAVAAEIPGTLGVTADVTSRADLENLWDRAVAAFGQVDIWVNNAGRSHARKPLWQIPAAELDEVIDLNLGGLARANAVVLARMAEQGHGAVWNMEGYGSDGMMQSGLTGYGATKRAVTYLTDSTAKDLDAAGLAEKVTVHHLSPGMVVTDLLTHDYTPEEFEKVKKIFNILADKVETVTPWLAQRVLAGGRNGSRVAWLTKGKAARRFATAAFNKRDLFAESAAS